MVKKKKKKKKPYDFLHTFSRSIQSENYTPVGIQETEKLSYFTYLICLVHNQMKIYINETAKTTSFYTFSVDL